jgi:hypothetical protein
MTARFYDRQVTFTLIKGLCDSHVAIEFPAVLVDTHSLERGQGGEGGQGGFDTEGAGAGKGAGVLGVLESAPLLPSSINVGLGRRMKDN